MGTSRRSRLLLLLLLGLAAVAGEAPGARALALNAERRLEAGGGSENAPLTAEPATPPPAPSPGDLVAAPAEAELHGADHAQRRPFVIPVVGVLLAVGFMFVAAMAVRRSSGGGASGERAVRLGRGGDEEEDDAELGLMAGAPGEREDDEKLDVADRHSVGVMY